MQDGLTNLSEFYKVLIENQGEGIGIVDLQESFIFVNPAAEEIFGVMKGGLKGRNLNEFLSPEHQETVMRESHERATRGKSSYDLEITRPSGEKRHLIVTANPWFSEEKKHIGTFGIFRDVSDRWLAEQMLLKQTAELQELVATRDKFFSIIAHDLKSPFNSILGLSEVLLNNFRDLDNEAVETGLRSILGSSKQAYNLLENLLLWSQSQRGKMSYVPENLYLAEKVMEVVRLIKGPAEQKDIRLIVSGPGHLRVSADKNMLQTVLRNLLSNAIKYTYRGGQITISAVHDHKMVRISVADNGMGIPDNSLKEIFRIESKTSTPGTEKERGSGLGLVLCHEFVSRHGGRIWVESQPGKGSTFSFTVPQDNDGGG